MRTFDSRHYQLNGFGSYVIDGVRKTGWVLTSLSDRRWDAGTYVPVTIFVPALKYVKVETNQVFFCKEDGSVENHVNELVEIPVYR